MNTYVTGLTPAIINYNKMNTYMRILLRNSLKSEASET